MVLTCHLCYKRAQYNTARYRSQQRLTHWSLKTTYGDIGQSQHWLRKNGWWPHGSKSLSEQILTYHQRCPVAFTCAHAVLMNLICVRRTLQWRHNGRDGVSNHQPRDCLLSRFIRRTSKKTSRLRVTGLCGHRWIPRTKASDDELRCVFFCLFVCFLSVPEQATGLDAWASRVKCPARFVSHLHDIYIYIYELFIAFVCFVVCSLL